MITGAQHLHAVRVLIERLGKRIGFDEIAEHVPNRHVPLVAHVRKQWEKLERKKVK
ncbi:hypothetical protein T492DRAFT_891909, partial [Pavlovales sp. CCMP2436]